MDSIVKIQGFGITDVGKVRSSNEDAYFYGELWNEQYILALAIDGCGGHRGGAEAARITREAVLQYLGENAEENKDCILKKAFVFANNKVHEGRMQNKELCDMCCVATAALVNLNEGNLHLAHVGDTRMYAFLNGRIIKLSHDHSPIGRDEESGGITEMEAMNSPYRNIIERAIGERYLNEDTDYIEDETFPITAGLTWLLCSDGLCDMITSARISDILGDDISLQQKAERLVAAANEAGGKDNITVVLFQTYGEDTSNATVAMDYYALKRDPNHTPSFSEMLADAKSRAEENEDNAALAERPECDTDIEERASMGGIEHPVNVPASMPDNTVHEELDSVAHPSPKPSQATPVSGKSFDVEQPNEPHNMPQTVAGHRSVAQKVMYFFIWLILVTVVVGGIIAYRSYMHRKTEEFNELIRKELLKRNQYYNAGDSVLL